MILDDWSGLLRVAAVGAPSYIVLVLLLRVAGKRSLSGLNAFDFVVTIALGSMLATTLLSSEVSLAEGVLAFAVLIGLQFAVTWLSARSSAVVDTVRAEPVLVVYRGNVLHDVMREQRVTEADLLQALRRSGLGSVAEAAAVVLETDGGLSVLKTLAADAGSTLDDVRGYHQRP